MAERLEPLSKKAIRALCAAQDLLAKLDHDEGIAGFASIIGREQNDEFVLSAGNTSLITDKIPKAIRPFTS